MNPERTREAWLAFAPYKSATGYSGLADGAHTFAVKAVDAGGKRSAPASRYWTVATTAAETAIDAGSNALTRSWTARLAFLASETGATFECSLDGSAFAASVSRVAHEVPDGSIHSHVRAVGSAGTDPTRP
jgi:large repetitive protein